METLLLLFALIMGAAVGFMIAHFKSRSDLSRLDERLENASEKLAEAERAYQEKLDELVHERERANLLDKELTESRAQIKYAEERLEVQKKELAEMQKQLTLHFENLANKILEEKTEKFTKQNREQLDVLLNPLGEKIEAFRKKVEETYDEENRQRATLKEQIKQMGELNQRMSEDAKNLTRALKGDSKTQGNWGEVILERILEKSGLSKGREYKTQASQTTEDGRRLQPDVVIHLPDNKFVIIDAKVSLTAYERYTSSEDEKEQQDALKQHLTSLRGHVNSLSEKNYQQLFADSPDFVLMFIPVEPAFSLAWQHDSSLYNDAFKKNIIITSPTTLLALLATIKNIWKQEYQNKNAQEIAKRGGALYDKFVNFIETLESIGTHISRLSNSYDDARKQLSEGRGNLVGQAEKLRKLGASNSKRIPDAFVQDDEDSEDENELLLDTNE